MNRHFNRLLDKLSDEQVSLILTGDCWELRDCCVCRSLERFELFRWGLADVHGRLTALGIAALERLIDDGKFPSLMPEFDPLRTLATDYQAESTCS